jgi:hypothetical protein
MPLFQVIVGIASYTMNRMVSTDSNSKQRNQLHRMRTGSIIFFTIAALNFPAFSGDIKHRFIAIDESRDSLVYTDENNPTTNWSVHIPKGRDFQLVGNNRVMICRSNGFDEYDLSNGKSVRSLSPSGISSVESCRRLPDGRTLLAVDGVTVYTIDTSGKVARTVAIANMGTFRTMRITAQNTWLLGSGADLVETDTNGVLIKRITVAGANNMYMAVRRPDGSMIADGGYACYIRFLKANGDTIKTIGGLPGPTGYRYNFFAGFQILANGHFVVSNWQGHGFNDGASGIGLIEFDTTGAIAWSWMDHARVSSLHAVIVLDGLNTAVINDDREGVIGPIKGATKTGYNRNAGHPSITVSSANVSAIPVTLAGRVVQRNNAPGHAGSTPVVSGRAAHRSAMQRESE